MASKFPATVRAPGRRYRTLDGVRGIAAMVVILVHAASSITPLYLQPRFGFLAVDLFFALSGFVLAYSYDRKFAAGMKPREFMIRRLIRLYPLFVLGLILGFGLRLVPAIRGATTTGGPMTLDEMGISAVFNVLMFPAPNGVENHFIFPADLPGWSLFFELWVASFIFGSFWKKLQGSGLGIFIAAAGLLMLANESIFHNIDVGALWTNFAGGFARVGFSFGIGLAIARFHAARPPNIRLPSWCIWVAVIPVLFVPFSHMTGHLYELFCISFIFPLLIYFGAEAIESHPSIASALGDASYPMYVIHVPLLSLLVWLAPGLVLDPSELYGIAFVLAVFGLSVLLARIYDEPVRKTLENALRQKIRATAVAQQL